ncbi:NDT80/PhoG-like protein [Tieghemostelium lacteum]|uniref:NDT80/PhoG-like protein n=1 Tax=Tieghemostelium lacteum TaxID=361077 RepID=A0A151Z2N1_TIELA|nr:NDT80/PhoG-like protein [Tieghemostelium lacteum]|eukprot:KYQ88188.1 NDT80/PhoG-like protein [Tieghemostelium lacteum]
MDQQNYNETSETYNEPILKMSGCLLTSYNQLQFQQHQQQQQQHQHQHQQQQSQQHQQSLPSNQPSQLTLSYESLFNNLYNDPNKSISELAIKSESYPNLIIQQLQQHQQSNNANQSNNSVPSIMINNNNQNSIQNQLLQQQLLQQHSQQGQPSQTQQTYIIVTPSSDISSPSPTSSNHLSSSPLHSPMSPNEIPTTLPFPNQQSYYQHHQQQQQQQHQQHQQQQQYINNNGEMNIPMSIVTSPVLNSTTTTTTTSNNNSNNKKLKRGYGQSIQRDEWDNYYPPYKTFKLFNNSKHDLTGSFNFKVKRIDKNIQFSDLDSAWILYRQNRFQVDCDLSGSLESWSNSDRAQGLIFVNSLDSNGATKLKEVSGLFFTLYVLKFGNSQSIVSPNDQSERVSIHQLGGSSGKKDGRLPVEPCPVVKGKANWTKLQFGSATANNARVHPDQPNPNQQFFRIVVTLNAIVQDNSNNSNSSSTPTSNGSFSATPNSTTQFIPIQSKISPPMIVRGQNPGRFLNQDKSSKKDNNSSPNHSKIENNNSHTTTTTNNNNNNSIFLEIPKTKNELKISTSSTSSSSSSDIEQQQQQSQHISSLNNVQNQMNVNNNISNNETQIGTDNWEFFPFASLSSNSLKIPSQPTSLFNGTEDIQIPNHQQTSTTTTTQTSTTMTSNIFNTPIQDQIMQQQQQQPQQQPQQPTEQLWIRNPFSSNGQDIIYTNGKVGINTTNPSQELTVNGNMLVTGELFKPSDRRIKRNIKEDQSDHWEKINQLKLYEYDRVKMNGYDKQSAAGDQSNVVAEKGFIAQEVQKVMPNAVKLAGDVQLQDGTTVPNLLVVNDRVLLMENIGATQQIGRTLKNEQQHIIQMDEEINRVKQEGKRDQHVVLSKMQDLVSFMLSEESKQQQRDVDESCIYCSIMGLGPAWTCFSLGFFFPLFWVAGSLFLFSGSRVKWVSGLANFLALVIEVIVISLFTFYLPRIAAIVLAPSIVAMGIVVCIFVGFFRQKNVESKKRYLRERMRLIQSDGYKNLNDHVELIRSDLKKSKTQRARQQRQPIVVQQQQQQQQPVPIHIQEDMDEEIEIQPKQPIYHRENLKSEPIELKEFYKISKGNNQILQETPLQEIIQNYSKKTLASPPAVKRTTATLSSSQTSTIESIPATVIKSPTSPKILTSPTAAGGTTQTITTSSTTTTTTTQY